MAKLQVEACNVRNVSGVFGNSLIIGISVSRADNGGPVTGLGKSNFRIADSIQQAPTDRVYTIVSVQEWTWQPKEKEPAGCYSIEIENLDKQDFGDSHRYVFGVQVRTFTNGPAGPPRPTDFGQTLVQFATNQ
jgi:hypothetical protein